jgi:uncharacterized protein involved in type VI secretion and phage assembly
MSDVYDQLFSGADQPADFYGLTVGIVTNNRDPDGLGRVKVRFPWLSDEVESQWARIVTPMAGPGRGLYTLPELDDEVLVAFERGRVEFPFILGALWNGRDKPPESNGDGKNNRRVIKSRSGHAIVLDDTNGREQIEIADASGKNKIVVNTRDNAIAIVAEGDIAIESRSGTLSLRGRQVEIQSRGSAKVAAAQNLDLQAGPQLNIKGQIVNIN